MENRQMEGLAEQLEIAARGLRDADKALAEAVNPTPSLESEAQESSPPDDLTEQVRAAFRKTEAELDTHNQRISALVDRVAILEAGPPSAGEGTESSPPPPGALWPQGYEYLKGVNRRLAALEDFRSTLRKRMNNAETRLAEMQEMILGVEQRLGDLEPGPPSQRIMASPTREASWVAEPCQHLNHWPIRCKGDKTVWCPDCQRDVLVPDSPPESTEAAIPGSSPSGQTTTPTFRVVPSCGCVPPFLTARATALGQVDIFCAYSHCGALLARVQTVVPDVPASATE